MNPPEKIFINYELGTNTTERLNPDDIEYHLAPVWHDAVKDPPKEDGEYLLIWCGKGGRPYYGLRVFRVKEGWKQAIPDSWMPLPEPPKESLISDRELTQEEKDYGVEVYKRAIRDGFIPEPPKESEG